MKKIKDPLLIYAILLMLIAGLNQKLVFFFKSNDIDVNGVYLMIFNTFMLVLIFRMILHKRKVDKQK